MTDDSGDRRIPRYIEAARALRDGHFGVDIPVSADQDEVSRLGFALRDLSISLERRWREIAEVDVITQRVNAGLLLDDVLEQFYAEARDIFPYDRIGFSLIEDRGTVVRARWAKSDAGPLRLGRGYAAALAGSSLLPILTTGRPRILNDLVAYLEAKPQSDSTRLIVEEGLRSSLTCPLIANGVPIGFMFFSSKVAGAYADAHVEAYQRVAGHLSVIVEKSRLISELSAQKSALEIRNRFITRVFGRYLSDEVVEQLLETPDGLRLGGERRIVTVVLTDLRGFTPMAERLPPEQVVSLLNLYLEVMTEVVVRHGGTIDEFIGDAILALFGAPIAREDDARRALACAVDMQRSMELVNERARDAGLPEMGMGIGIHTGEVVVGNIGSERRAKYGVVGTAINLASRIQGYTLGGQILASEEAVAAAGAGILTGAGFSVHPKGIQLPVSILEVLGVGESRIAVVSDQLAPLGSPIQIEVERVKPAAPRIYGLVGFLHAIGRWEAAIETDAALNPRDEVRLTLPGGIEVRARVLGPAGRGAGVRIRFFELPAEAMRLVATLSGTAVPLASG